MQVVEAGVTNAFRTILVIIGAIVLLRFLGQVLTAKRNMEDERAMNERQRNLDKERSEKLKRFGRTSIIGTGKSKKETSSSVDVVDVDFEEIKE